MTIQQMHTDIVRIVEDILADGMLGVLHSDVMIERRRQEMIDRAAFHERAQVALNDLYDIGMR
jgi:hypothetical protein